MSEIKPKLILASNSPRRKELLENAGFEFKVVKSKFQEEDVNKDLPVNMYVQQLAMFKACAVAREIRGNHIVIGADTIVYHPELGVLGKPDSREDAVKMLKNLSARPHKVYTGIALVRTKDFKIVTDWEETDVYFKQLSDWEINYYIDAYKPFDKAGSYGIQEYAGVFVEKISGDYFNVVGLPLCKLNNLLNNEF